ncbi:FG-GAP repeat domain-containing protein, partial [Persicitalea sp.]|uniref:FG-GAP repeat domain-containing protein n=1 Tax=Persicitalea sp. TaxID=3100273 RepID=UPI003593A5AB
MKLCHKYFSWMLLAGLFACRSSPEPMFQLLENEKTGVDFVNSVKPSPEFNIFSYMYFYNGGGVGAGDFNNDGLVDLIFTANQTADRLFLNQGNMKFKDVTDAAGLGAIKGWHTGVSVVDINQDGLLDFYVSCVAKYSGAGS